MKRKIITISFLIAAAIIIFTSIGQSNSGGAVWGVCGAPGDQATPIGIACGYPGCHNFPNPLFDNPSVTISLIDPSTNQPVNTYKENVKYIVKIELTRASIVDCGFESTVQNALGNYPVGKFAPKIKSQVTQGNSNYVTHSTYTKTSAGYGMWEYYWTSPNTERGDIIIYAACNDGNGKDNYGGTGDSIFTASKTFSHNSGIANTIIPQENVSVFPNPARDHFTIGYNLLGENNTNIDLYNMNGVLVKSIQNGMMPQGENKTDANIAGLPTGIYFVRIEAGGESVVKKVMVGN